MWSARPSRLCGLPILILRPGKPSGKDSPLSASRFSRMYTVKRASRRRSVTVVRAITYERFCGVCDVLV